MDIFASPSRAHHEAWNCRGNRAFRWSGRDEPFGSNQPNSSPDAPVVGHGRGPGLVTHSLHNQILAVAVQLGLVGTVALIAMWRPARVVSRGYTLFWLGLMIVVQNIASSLFNSYLTEFTKGWIHVLGVGAVGGMVLRRAPAPQKWRG